MSRLPTVVPQRRRDPSSWEVRGGPRCTRGGPRVQDHVPVEGPPPRVRRRGLRRRRGRLGRRRAAAPAVRGAERSRGRRRRGRLATGHPVPSVRSARRPHRHLRGPRGQGVPLREGSARLRRPRRPFERRRAREVGAGGHPQLTRALREFQCPRPQRVEKVTGQQLVPGSAGGPRQFHGFSASAGFETARSHARTGTTRSAPPPGAPERIAGQDGASPRCSPRLEARSSWDSPRRAPRARRLAHPRLGHPLTVRLTSTDPPPLTPSPLSDDQSENADGQRDRDRYRAQRLHRAHQGARGGEGGDPPCPAAVRGVRNAFFFSTRDDLSLTPPHSRSQVDLRREADERRQDRQGVQHRGRVGASPRAGPARRMLGGMSDA